MVLAEAGLWQPTQAQEMSWHSHSNDTPLVSTEEPEKQMAPTLRELTFMTKAWVTELVSMGIAENSQIQ